MNKEEDDAELVYSTDLGDLRKGGDKGGKKDGKGKQKKGGAPPGDEGGGVKVRREKKGRGGKTVTAVYGIPLDGAELKELGKKLKQSCGAGGSVKNGVIEIQGDNVEKVVEILEKNGYNARRAGG